MTGSKWILGAVSIALVTVLVCALGGVQGAGSWISTVSVEQMLAPPLAQAKEVSQPARKSQQMSPYDIELKPLTTAECGQCHFSIFETIKEQGVRHQIDCVRCHREYHAYNPRKQNYDEIMPRCAWCHVSATGGAFHGEDKALTPCLNCHGDPHKPLTIPMAQIDASCVLCHTKEGHEIENYASKHTTEVACADCHADKHGHIPECSACHESHSPGVELTAQDCMTCHPVHKPTQIAYQKETQSTICAGCHEEVYNVLQAKQTKHTPVACAECHPAHREIPLCSRCHGEPHPKEMLMDTAKCGDCHEIAHQLLM